MNQSSEANFNLVKSNLGSENETLESLANEERALQLELETLEEEVNGMDERERAIGERV